ncbi:MAG TPA: PD-(D/E)XK nuclease family protein [Gaiellales bacterium]|nr:PD-(D/E)XK nuclease family protein [Gaiellales bacterium]
MPLTLLLGPANCGKVAQLFDRFAEQIDAGAAPTLVVPTRPDVELAERDLLARRSAVLGGMIGTFEDLFERVLERCGEPSAALATLPRRLVLEQVVREAGLDQLAAPSRFSGFVDGLGRMFNDLAGSAPPELLERRLAAFAEPGRRLELAVLHGAFRARLAELGIRDRAGGHGRAAELLETRLEAWDDSPVFAYGFEDMSGVQLAALRALAARCPVMVSLPYEPGRPALAAVRPAVAALTEGPHELVELPPADHVDSPALRHLERTLFDERDAPPPPERDGSMVLLEACGMRGVADQVAFEALALIRQGIAAEQIAVLATDTGRWRLALESAFAALDVPVDVDAQVGLGETAFGQALLGLLRFAWFDGDRADLFRFLRSPFSGVPRATVDYAEGRLRGRGALRHDEVQGLLEELDYARLLAAPDRLAGSGDPAAAVGDQLRRMSASVAGLTANRLNGAGEAHAAALRATLRTLEQLAGVVGLGLEPLDRAGVAGQLERTVFRPYNGCAGRVQALDLRRARTRRFQAVFVLGLEEGGLPGPARENPFLSGDEAAALGVSRLDPLERDRHLFYTAVTRPWRHLFLCRQAADEDGRLLEPSPFLEDVVRSVGEDGVERRRRAIGDLTHPLEQAPSERERQRALARELRTRPDWAAAVADHHGWTRKLERARLAYRRRPQLRNATVLAALAAQERFSVTELEKFAECSSAWFVERFLQPGEIDYQFGPKETGSVAHATLHKFHERMPSELGVERLTEHELPAAVELMRRCLQDSLGGVRIPAGVAGRAQIRRLERDLEGFLASEATFDSPLVPRDYEVRFGTKTSRPDLQQGLRLDGFAVSGTIDRIDRDPGMSARGAVWDYKTGKGARSAKQIETERKLQLPLYILVARDMLGIEPVAGLYRALGGERRARGMAVEGEMDGVMANDRMQPELFWAQVDRAVGYANDIVARIRSGAVHHDPISGSCPEWCLRQAGGICRVAK